jgi:hypothetical protein
MCDVRGAERVKNGNRRRVRPMAEGIVRRGLSAADAQGGALVQVRCGGASGQPGGQGRDDGGVRPTAARRIAAGLGGEGAANRFACAECGCVRRRRAGRERADGGAAV